MAAAASTHGTARGTMQGSCRPWMTSVVSSIRDRLTESCCPGNGRRRLERRAEHDRHPVRDPAQDPAAVVRFRDDLSVFHAERVVILAAAQPCGGKARAEFHALDRRNGEYRARNAVFQPAEHRIADARRQPLYHALDHAADGVLLRLRLCDLRLHGRSRLVRDGRERFFVDRRVKLPHRPLPRRSTRSARASGRPRLASTCRQMPPAMHSGAVSRPEKCPPPAASCAPPNLTCAV